MVLPWGKYNVFVKDLDAASDSGYDWTLFPTPKEQTVAVNPSEGDKLEAKEEGGGVVDARRSKSTYEVVYELFQKKGEAHPLAAKTVDGMVIGNYALAIQPAEDTAVQGIYVGKSTIGASDALSSQEGGSTTYTHSAVIPTGDETAKKTIGGIDHYASVCWKVITAEKKPTGYIDATSSDDGALKVVASGATTGQINLADVTPYLGNKTLAANDYVKMQIGTKFSLTFADPGAE